VFWNSSVHLIGQFIALCALGGTEVENRGFRVCRARPRASRVQRWPRRELLGVSRLTALGWRARIGLEEGLRWASAWYRENVGVARG